VCRIGDNVSVTVEDARPHLCPTWGAQYIIVSNVMNSASEGRNGFARSDYLRCPVANFARIEVQIDDTEFDYFIVGIESRCFTVNDANYCVGPYFSEGIT